MWERRRRSFENTAKTYDRVRPGYPEALFERIRSYADLAPDDFILEVGAGTGKASTHFAAWGNPFVIVEPAEAMADVARSNLADHDHVEIRVERFEDAELPRSTFGLVACAQAWHWIDRATRNERLADVLYAHGTAAIMGNVQVTPDEDRAFFVRVQDVYNDIAPDLAHQGEFKPPSFVPPHSLEASSLFEDHAMLVEPWEWTLTTECYIELMSTASSHAALDANVRERLLDGIASLIDAEFGGTVTEHYNAVAGLARRV